MSGKKKMIIKIVSPKMAKYLKDHPYMEPDGLQENAGEKTDTGTIIGQLGSYNVIDTTSRYGKLKNIKRRRSAPKIIVIHKQVNFHNLDFELIQ